jgi:hypothetical protein
LEAFKEGTLKWKRAIKVDVKVGDVFQLKIYKDMDAHVHVYYVEVHFKFKMIHRCRLSDNTDSLFFSIYEFAKEFGNV